MVFSGVTSAGLSVDLTPDSDLSCLRRPSSLMLELSGPRMVPDVACTSNLMEHRDLSHWKDHGFREAEQSKLESQSLHLRNVTFVRPVISSSGFLISSSDRMGQIF